MTADTPVLRLADVSRRYSATAPAVLDGLDFALAPGEYVAIMGESGVGKSTLLNIMAGLDRPDTGRIEVDGRDLAGLDDDALTVLRRTHLGFVFQAFHVLPYLTVRDNVALPLDLASRPGAEREARVVEMLEAVGLAGRAGSYPRELSGGETQRVAIARALVHRPRLLLADEPTGNLDPRTATHILALLRGQVHAQGASGVLITHSLAAAQTADRILVLEGGRLSPYAARA
ncbi:MAG: ABC transporter ATP-binding protein [Steroidobacteraceae bacterium]|nr:ABC transporter ATP-binding protein [Steroidobacteraceae bacterium]